MGTRHRKIVRHVVLDLSGGVISGLSAPKGIDIDTQKLSKPLEQLIARHAEELWGSLFYKTTPDDPKAAHLLVGGLASEAICRQVVRRIARNVLKAVQR